MTSNPTRLDIRIERPPSTAHQILRAFATLGMIIFIPMINELVLNGHWSINLIGAVMGLVVVVAASTTLIPTWGRFETKEEAAEWVLSGQWEKQP